MAGAEDRNKGQIRDEIRSERQQLDEAVAALAAGARQMAGTARSALTALGTVGTVLVIARRLRRRSR